MSNFDSEQFSIERQQAQKMEELLKQKKSVEFNESLLGSVIQDSKYELDTQGFDMDSDFGESKRSSSRASLVLPNKQTWGE